MEKEKLATIESLSIGYGKTKLIGNISFDIEKGSFIGIIGPNGGGKSTLLKTVIGLVPALDGTVSYPRKIIFGYVPQSPSFDKMFPLSAYQIVTTGLYSRFGFLRNPGEKDKEKIYTVMKRLHIEHLKHRPFRLLSGGEKQRVLIARALVGEPDIVAMDEPESSIDPKGEAEIVSLVTEIKEKRKQAVIVVSHRIDLITKYADKILIIDKDRQVFLEKHKEEALKYFLLA